MAWKEKMKEYGGGDLTFLSEDGEVLFFVVVGDPVLLEGKYKGKPSVKIGAPVVTEDGFQMFVCGKRLARKISKYDGQYDKVAFLAVRHGEMGDINSTYELSLCDNKEKTKQLLAIAKRDFEPSMIAEAVTSALEVMQG